MAAAKFNLFPSLDLSNLDLSKVSLPKVSVPNIDTEALSNVARDAAYVVVGLAVVALQRTQVLRREVVKSLSDQVADSKPQLEEIMSGVESRLASIDGRIESLEGKLDEAVTDLEKRLPERAGAMLVQAHDIAKAARKQVRSRIVTAA